MLARFRRSVITAQLDDDVSKVAASMRDARVGCVVVVDGRRPVGIVTDRDLALRVVAESRDPMVTPVRDVMTTSPITLEENHTIESALRALRAASVRRLPLVDADGELVGMLTADDMVLLLSEEFGLLAAGMENAVDAPELR